MLLFSIERQAQARGEPSDVLSLMAWSVVTVTEYPAQQDLLPVALTLIKLSEPMRGKHGRPHQNDEASSGC